MTNIAKINNLHLNINSILTYLNNNEVHNAYSVWESIPEEDQNEFSELKSYFKKYIFLKESINNQILTATKAGVDRHIQEDIDKLAKIESLIKSGKKNEALRLSQTLEYLEVPDNVWNFLNSIKQ